MKYYFIFCFALSLLESFNCTSELCPKTILNSSQGNIEASGDDLCRIWTIDPPENVIITLRLNRLVFKNCNDIVFEIRNAETRYNACIKTKKPKLLMTFRKFPIQITMFTKERAAFAIEFFSRNSTSCPTNDFQCADNNKCFNYHQICDGKFDCQDRSDEICEYCPKNTVPCSNNGKNCFNPKTERCNGNYDCPLGEDELNCTKRCINAFSCKESRKCFQFHERCNGVNECNEGTDEINCTSIDCEQRTHFLCDDGSCIEKHLVGDGRDDCADGSDEKSKHKAVEIILMLVFIILFCCSIVIIHRWCTTRRNIGHLIRNPPEFPQPPFRGPGEYAGYELQFSDCDYRHGGEIYEGFIHSRREGRRLGRTRMHRRRSNSHVHNVTPRSSITNLDDSTLAALVSLGIPPEFCVGLDNTRKEVEHGSRASTEETDSFWYITLNWGRNGTGDVRVVSGEEEMV